MPTSQVGELNAQRPEPGYGGLKKYRFPASQPDFAAPHGRDASKVRGLRRFRLRGKRLS
ncbi:MAG TPA: hypothetical protein VL985_09810 [Stellaceae bacterium]|nr:hypothetical protein [Stellaceae bacterium]